MIFYHGTPISTLSFLKKGSFVSPCLAIAELMGRFHLDNGKTWNDDDLIEPYFFGKTIKWRVEPKGVANIYFILASDNDLDFLDNPYEHVLKNPLRCYHV